MTVFETIAPPDTTTLLEEYKRLDSQQYLLSAYLVCGEGDEEMEDKKAIVDEIHRIKSRMEAMDQTTYAEMLKPRKTKTLTIPSRMHELSFFEAPTF